ncbi:MAG TPA: pentapeptide repeat-containing protein, partial [Oligoflexus sp.]|uniref:pentapeptide repeat-containing protein n=1 Tax=Oligoflexus sp. TaxID=1971216 RepID=UPI002D43DC27
VQRQLFKPSAKRKTRLHSRGCGSTRALLEGGPCVFYRGTVRLLDPSSKMLRHAWMGLVLLAGQTVWAGVSEDLEKLLATGSCHGCDLSGVDLNGQTLNWTSLKNSRLVGANLSGAEIRVAQNIEGNDFSGANLKGTKVWTPQLNGNIFKGTDLSEASLNASSGHGLQWSFQRNQFIQATLTDAVISTDLCYLTTFTDSNLTRMKFTAYWVARACNVSQSKAEGSEWSG